MLIHNETVYHDPSVRQKRYTKKATRVENNTPSQFTVKGGMFDNGQTTKLKSAFLEHNWCVKIDSMFHLDSDGISGSLPP